MVLQPHYCRNNNGLGYSPFARHYLGNHYCFLFLQVLRCFSSLGLLSLRNDPYGSGFPIRRSSDQEVIRHLPEAYRSLSRPSSPLRAKAFIIRPYLLSKVIKTFPTCKRTVIDLLSIIVENIGLEPMTSCVQGRRSSQLS